MYSESLHHKLQVHQKNGKSVYCFGKYTLPKEPKDYPEVPVIISTEKLSGKRNGKIKKERGARQ